MSQRQQIAQEALAGTSSDTLLEAAIGYAAGGWAVFPVFEPNGGRCACGDESCSSPGKHPRVARGLHDATTDKAKISEWWTRWPNANIGIRTGKLVVLDLDGDAAALIGELAQRGITLPDTPRARTGGGGCHLFFRSHGEEVQSRAAILSLPPVNGAKRSQIDVRGTGGYVVATPSVHVSGCKYAWERDPLTAELAPFPPGLQDLARRPRAESVPWASRSESDSAWFDAVRGGVPEGQRNETAARLAGYWLTVTHGNEQATFRAMEEWAWRCTPPMDLRELQTTIRSVARREVAKSTAPAPGPGGFTRPLSALLAAPDLPVSYLVDRLLVEGANGFLGGEPKSLKSWLALYLSVCGSLGVPVFGRYPVAAPFRVLYVQEEDGERRVRRRIRKILRGLDAKAPDDSLFRYSIKAGLLLDDERWIKALTAELDAFRPGLVVCDVFELMHARDSDRRAELKPVLYRLDRMREEYGSAFLLVDHFRKQAIGTSKRGGQRLAGTTGKHAWGEASLYLFPTAGKNRVRVETELKDGPAEAFTLTLEDTEGGGVRFAWAPEQDERAGEMKVRVLEALESVASRAEWVPAKPVAEAAGIATNTATKWLNALTDDGTLERDRRRAGKVMRSEWRLRA